MPTSVRYPSGLVALFFAEMWERFSYYGMRAILVLYLTAAVADDGLAIRESTANAVYGTVQRDGLPDGAARRLGRRPPHRGPAQRAVVGGVVIAAGHYVMAIPAGGASSPA